MSGIYENADRYDEIYASFTADLSFYREVAAECEGPVCDLACGTGRVTISLSEAFPERLFYGVDTSASQLSRARERAAGSGNLRWIDSSMVDVCPPEPCGLAICALHSLEHLTEEVELDRFFENLREAVLRPGGVFAFAIHLPDPRYLVRDPERLEEVGRYGAGERAFTLYERRSYDASTQVLSLTWLFEGGPEQEVESASYELRLLYPREIRRILRVHRFELLGHWGWYDRSPLTSDSGTQVILCRRLS
jgi:SAM-dependent methyltransferase